MIRDMEKLRRNQAEVMDSYKEEAERSNQPAMLPRPGNVVSVVTFGRVTEVVSTDTTFGPHLLVVRQQWNGTPPAASDSTMPCVRCYPSPNHTTGDYGVNEYVRISTVHGAKIAEKPG
jgi:hypothetical protein